MDCSTTHPLYDNSSWSFEFYNHSLYAYQFGLLPMIPHSTLSFPVDLTHIASEILSKNFSKATVQLLSTLSQRFISPMVKMDPNTAGSYASWWKLQYLALVPSVLYHLDTRKRGLAMGKDTLPTNVAKAISAKGLKVGEPSKALGSKSSQSPKAKDVTKVVSMPKIVPKERPLVGVITPVVHKKQSLVPIILRARQSHFMMRTLQLMIRSMVNKITVGKVLMVMILRKMKSGTQNPKRPWEEFQILTSLIAIPTPWGNFSEIHQHVVMISFPS